MTMNSLKVAVCLLGLALFASALDAKEPAEPAGVAVSDFFERKVRPLLVEKCQACHGEKKSRANLRLLSRAAILEGGDSGAAAVPGKPAESLLVQAVEYSGELQMPPDAKLPEDEIATLKRWVELGLPWPLAPAGITPEHPAGDGRWTSEQRQWWSFQPLGPTVPPPVRGTAPIRNAIDRFVQSQIDAARSEPFPPADK